MGSTEPTKPQALVFYLRDVNGHPIVTVAFRHETSADGTDVTYATATKNPTDQMSKAYGRNRALGRLKGDKEVKRFKISGAPRKNSEIEFHIAADIVNDHSRRVNIRNLAYYWNAQYLKKLKKPSQTATA